MFSSELNKKFLSPLLIVVLLFCAVGGFLIWQRVSGRSFDSELWKRGSREAFAHRKPQELSKTTRDKMVTDLLKHHRLLGMRRGEILDLLGEPDFAKKDPFKDWDMIYWLGPDDHGLFGSLDSKWLVLRLDTTNKVTEWKVTFD